MTGLHVWLDANQLALTNNSLVSTWADSSGNNLGSLTAAGASRPTFLTNFLNGKPVIHFNNHYLSTSTNAFWNGLTAGEVFVVMKGDTGQGTSPSFGLWSFPPCNDFEIYPFSDLQVYDGFMSTIRKVCGNPGTGFQFNWHTYNVTSTASEYTARLNGTQFFTTGTNTVNTSLGSVGSAGFGLSRASGFFFTGWLAEILLYDHSLSSTDRTAVATYINAKYGI